MFNVGKVIKFMSILLFLIILGLSWVLGAIIIHNIPSDITSEYIILYYLIDTILLFVFFLMMYGFGALIDTNTNILYTLKKSSK